MDISDQVPTILARLCEGINLCNLTFFLVIIKIPIMSSACIFICVSWNSVLMIKGGTCFHFTHFVTLFAPNML